MTTPESVYAELTECKALVTTLRGMLEEMNKEAAKRTEVIRQLETQLEVARSNWADWKDKAVTASQKAKDLEITLFEMQVTKSEIEARANVLQLASNDAQRALRLVIDTLEQA